MDGLAAYLAARDRCLAATDADAERLAEDLLDLYDSLPATDRLAINDYLRALKGD